LDVGACDPRGVVGESEVSGALYRAMLMHRKFEGAVVINVSIDFQHLAAVAANVFQPDSSHGTVRDLHYRTAAKASSVR